MAAVEFAMLEQAVARHRKLNDRKAILGWPRLDGSCPSDLRPHVSGDVEEVGDRIMERDEALDDAVI